MKQIAYLKPDAEHLNVRETPNGKVIGSITAGVMIQLTGKEKNTETVTWVEGFYAGNHKIVRGWMAKKWLTILPDPEFNRHPPPLEMNAILDGATPLPKVVDAEQKLRGLWDGVLGLGTAVLFIAVSGLVLFGMYSCALIQAG